jgi:hypothetical protein
MSPFAHKTPHNRTLLFGSILVKYGCHFDYWNQPLNMRIRVCYLDCLEGGLCCYLVIHIENLLRPLQLLYFQLWLSLVLLISPTRATWPAHSTIPDVIALTIYSGESSCHFSPSCPKISDTFGLHSTLTRSLSHKQQTLVQFRAQGCWRWENTSGLQAVALETDTAAAWRLSSSRALLKHSG